MAILISSSICSTMTAAVLSISISVVRQIANILLLRHHGTGSICDRLGWKGRCARADRKPRERDSASRNMRNDAVPTAPALPES